MSSRAIEKERQNLIDKYNAHVGRVGGVTQEERADLQNIALKADLDSPVFTGKIGFGGGYYWASAATLADTGTVTLPTITANYPAHGFIQCAHASTGVISESAEFEFGSTGAVQIIRGTANIEANAATAGKISIGPAVAANPVVIKNNLGGGVSVNAMITLWYA